MENPQFGDFNWSRRLQMDLKKGSANVIINPLPALHSRVYLAPSIGASPLFLAPFLRLILQWLHARLRERHVARPQIDAALLCPNRGPGCFIFTDAFYHESAHVAGAQSSETQTSDALLHVAGRVGDTCREHPLTVEPSRRQSNDFISAMMVANLTPDKPWQRHNSGRPVERQQ